MHLCLRVGVHIGPALRLDLPAILQSKFWRLLPGPQERGIPYSTAEELPTIIHHLRLR